MIPKGAPPQDLRRDCKTEWKLREPKSKRGQYSLADFLSVITERYLAVRTEIAAPCIGHVGILDVIGDLCEADKSYGTMALFSLISKHHHGIFQSRLRRIKKRFVLDLDEIEWGKKDNDANIE